MGIIMLFQNNLVYASYLIWLAALLDFFDGFFARLLKAYSPMGKELDSLADMVSFGVLPSLILFMLIKESTTNIYLPFLALIMAAFSALRLANFNIDQRQSETFIGLPTPANAIFISSLPIIIYYQDMFFSLYLMNVWVLVFITLVFSFLLVAELPLFSLKFRNYKWSENKIRFSFLIISILVLLFFKIIAVPIIIVLYIIVSLIQNSTRK
ncbi:MAG: CDP-diacylglycerol--serine O-phosphatidyltransferase [Bacteroidota bacterium]|nr:CDP-diacylglycerol--serine O-phosphatidyltransferase [Bacteroidota bacterium]